MVTPDPDTFTYTAEELCSRIATLTHSIMDFWNSSGGWAPAEAYELLNRSMLEWQKSLSSSLRRWIRAVSPGDLILAWANLGALVEGQLKLFLSVRYLDYKSDASPIQRRGKQLDPDVCAPEELRQFFVKRIWNVGTNWNPYVEMVQQRRNAIHAYQPQDIGTFPEWQDALRLQLSFVRDVGGGLPYPDSHFCGLREV
ncbi:MAG: hypothetical protein JSW27_15155 [Phycisphaerales bacterium]|nr:MAG: hypothetical protein JSW27_15155 [Phycisphaerales bacterium]